MCVCVFHAVFLLLGLDCKVLIQIRCYCCANASDLAFDSSYKTNDVSMCEFSSPVCGGMLE